MKEWTNPYNPFNSMKVLTWPEHLQGIVNQDFLPPVSADTDPSNRCNFNCIWCNAFESMQGQKRDIPEDHLLKLADFYKEWGVYSTCIGGGGEPLMNKGVGKFLLRLQKHKIESGLITNGSLMYDKLIEIMARTCKWVGISVDAATSETFMQVKGISNKIMFDCVINNIRKLVLEIKKQKTGCTVGFKYLLHPINAKEILMAAKLAKAIGVNDFHCRPVGWVNLLKTKDKKEISFVPVINEIDEQIEQAMKLENESFHFYGIRHKFRPNMQPKTNFKRCWATPLVLTFNADGNCHLCFDRRGIKEFILCSHYPDPHEVLKHWNTKRHKRILRDIDVSKCPRCAYSPFHEIIEKVFIEDGMCRKFV